MSDSKKGKGLQRSPALQIATVAILTAVTGFLTYIIKIPIYPTRGYFNLGDVAIYFSAFTLGPITALLSGGLGTALADLLSPGFQQWAPISLFVHGAQGLVVALIARLSFSGREKQRKGAFSYSWLVAAAAGTLVMCGGYLAAGSAMVGFGAALGELPFNLVQNLAGVLGGIPLSLAVRRAYPPVAELRW